MAILRKMKKNKKNLKKDFRNGRKEIRRFNDRGRI